MVFWLQEHWTCSWKVKKRANLRSLISRELIRRQNTRTLPQTYSINASNLAGYAKYPLSDLEDSDFGKYTTQLAVLSKILRDKYAIDVGENMFLLQIHDVLWITDVPHRALRERSWTQLDLYLNQIERCLSNFAGIQHLQLSKRGDPLLAI